MKCIELTELKQYLKGKLPTDRMLAIDEHITECEKCKITLMSLSSIGDFTATIIGANNCPEYEELSAYVDESLDAKRTDAIRLHINLCELCAKDIDRIRELRSHAALREKITVRPGMTIQNSRTPFAYWKKALAGISIAGLVTITVMFGNLGSLLSKAPTQVAVNPPISNQFARPLPDNVPAVSSSKPTAPVNKPIVPATNVAVNPGSTHSAKPVLRDGNYSVINKNGALALANCDGTPVRATLSSRIAASIAEKLRTGKINAIKPLQTAMASINMRDTTSGYEASPTAPKQIAPVGKVVLSAKPSLSWSAVELADSYRVRIYDKAGNIVVDQVTEKNSIIPSRSLPRGQAYSWRVGVRFGETDQWAESAASKFAVISAQDYASIKQVQNKMPGSHLAMGAAYESVGLYDEAASEYRMLRRANPNSKLAQKILYGTVQH